MQNDLSLPKYDLSKAAIENDTGLRLLVTMTVSTTHRQNPFEVILLMFVGLLVLNRLARRRCTAGSMKNGPWRMDSSSSRSTPLTPPKVRKVNRQNFSILL